MSLADREIDPDAMALLPREAAWLNHALPIGYEDGVPLVAVDDPADEVAMRNVRSLIAGDVRFAVATRSEILEVLAPGSAAGESPRERVPPPAPVPAPQAPQAAAAVDGTGVACRVVLRLADGDRVEVGSFPSIHRAQEEAKSVIRRLAMASASEWPLFERRFVRPDNIVSVDLVADDEAP